MGWKKQDPEFSHKVIDALPATTASVTEFTEAVSSSAKKCGFAPRSRLFHLPPEDLLLVDLKQSESDRRQTTSAVLKMELFKKISVLRRKNRRQEVATRIYAALDKGVGFMPNSRDHRHRCLHFERMMGV